MPLHNDRMKQRRQFKGIAQQDLAQTLQVSQQQIARWENAANDPSADAVARLARALDCTTDWLLGLVEQPHAHARARELSADEQQLLDLYRQGKLPDMITRLVHELAAPRPKEKVIVNDPDQT
jgi:transcriptional regulator with XRE-family HTH domain